MLTNRIARTSADFKDSDSHICGLAVENGIFLVYAPSGRTWITIDRELAREIGSVLLHYADTGNLIDSEEQEP